MLVIPCIERRFDGARSSATASAFGSILPGRVELPARAARHAASARCGRPRTSGTRRRRPRVLGIPDTVTQVAMFPVAYTIGTDFKRATATARVGHVLERRGEPLGDARCRHCSGRARPTSTRRCRGTRASPASRTRRRAAAGDGVTTRTPPLRPLPRARRGRPAVASTRSRRRRSSTPLRPTTRSPATGPVIDVQTHLVDPARWQRRRRGRARRLPAAWSTPTAGRDAVDPHLLDAAAWAALVFASSETAIALLTSTPGRRRPQRADQPADRRDARARRPLRRAAAGCSPTRSCTRTSARPSSTRWRRLTTALRPSGWKCYTLYGPPTNASPTGGWFLDDDEIGFPFLERVRALGPQRRRDAQGPRRPDPDRVGRGGVAARHRTGRRRVPRHQLRRVPLGLRARSRRRGRRVRPDAPRRGVDRLVASLARRRASARAPTCTPSSAPPGS